MILTIMVEEIRQGDIPGVQLRYRHVLATTPDNAWSWVTELEKQAFWLADRIETDPDTAGVLHLESLDSNGQSYRERLSTVIVEPRRLWITDLQNVDDHWPVPTRLEFELHTCPAGTEISVLQKGFAHLPLSDCLTIWEFYRRRWRTALARLAEQLESDH